MRVTTYATLTTFLLTLPSQKKFQLGLPSTMSKKDKEELKELINKLIDLQPEEETG